MTPQQSTDRLQGTLDLLVLKTLAGGSMHGWNVALRIQQVSRDALQINQAPPRTTVAPGSIASRRAAGSSWSSRRTAGVDSPRLSR